MKNLNTYLEFWSVLEFWQINKIKFSTIWYMRNNLPFFSSTVKRANQHQRKKERKEKMRQSARICRCCNVSEWSAQRVRKYEGRKKGEEKGSRGRVGGRSREAKESKWPGRNGDQRRRGNTEPRREGRALSLSLSLSLGSLAAFAASCCSIRAARLPRIRTAELWKWSCVTRQPPLLARDSFQQ